MDPLSTCRDEMVLTGRRFPDGAWTSIAVQAGRITTVQKVRSVEAPETAQRWVLPGFFDIQLNGFAGRNFTDTHVTVADAAHIARMVLRTGTTRFLPTIVTADLDVMCRQLSVIAQAMTSDPLVAGMCPGMHVEGPFIHPADGPRGAHPREHVREPSIADFERLWEASCGKIALLTLAPDRPGAIELIRHARQRGVVVGLGHHRADQAALDAAIEAGAALSTHLGNGTDAELPRHDNYVWYQLGDDRLWASLIADGHHLPAATLRCMLRAKTPARSVLITDAVGAATMPPGRYRLGDTDVELTTEGKVILPGTPYQAGSAADMPTVIRRAVIDGGVSFAESVAMASLQPRKLLADRVPSWSCEPGDPADLVELDWHPENGRITIRQVVFGDFAVRLEVAPGLPR